MSKEYHVTFWYLATGMEGMPDVRDYGIVRASSKEEAMKLVAKREAPKYVEWMLSCLSATEVPNVRR